jgi:hypothetical protein
VSERRSATTSASPATIGVTVTSTTRCPAPRPALPFGLAAALALLALLAPGLACESPSSSATLVPGPTNVTAFHLSILNACAADVTLLVGTQVASGRKVLLFKKARDTISGTNEAVWLLDEREAPIAMYQPIQGDQRLTISSDCSDLRKDL